MIRTITRAFTAALVLIPGFLLAQQDPYYTHFTFNKVFYNPAYAGASGSFCLNAITHQQWRSLEDQTAKFKTASGLPTSDNLPNNIAPKTTGFAFSAPLNIRSKKTDEVKNYGGAYVGFVRDQIAYELNTYLRGGVAGAYTLSNGSSIRLGVDFLSLTKQLDGSGLRAHDTNDPNIPVGQVGATHVTLGAGLYYTNPNFHNFYAGFSTSHIIPQTFTYGNQGAIQVTTARHYYMLAGAKIENFMGNPSLTFDPAVLIKTVNNNSGNVKPQIDLQGMVTWNQLYAGGINLRAWGVGLEALSFMFGYYPPLKGNDPSGNGQSLLRVGYSYDLTLQSLRRSSFGTHELQVNYCFRIVLPEKVEIIYRHPRYMQRPQDIE